VYGVRSSQAVYRPLHLTAPGPARACPSRAVLSLTPRAAGERQGVSRTLCFEGMVLLGRLLADVAIRPTLFLWNGPINPQRLELWAVENEWQLPDDLKAFWVTTGGGQMFETEAMLGPFVDAAKGNAAHLTDTNVVGANRRYHSAGLRSDLLVIHEGAWVTCCDLQAGRYVVIDSQPPFQMRESYENFANWYNGLVRAEYAARYSLPE
jgi:hypothetical protein